MVYFSTSFQIDVKLKLPMPFQRNVLSRHQRHTAMEIWMKVKSLWGLPVLKLLAGSSLAGSSRNAAAMYLVRQMFFFASPDYLVFL